MTAAAPRILVVDDSQAMLQLERQLLVAEGYEVLSARDGLQAVVTATQERPDLILMDLMMPKLDGLEASRRLRAQEATRHIPIIMVSTWSELEAMEGAYASGCNDYVTKPIDPTELVVKVEMQLEAAGALHP